MRYRSGRFGPAWTTSGRRPKSLRALTADARLRTRMARFPQVKGFATAASVATMATCRSPGRFGLLLVFLLARAEPPAKEEPRPSRKWGESLRYYVYLNPLIDFSHLLECPGVHELINSAHGEGLQEIHVYKALVTDHPQRVMNPKDANAFYVPVMEYLSWKVQTCNGVSHSDRIHNAYTELRKSPYFRKRTGRDHFWVSSKSFAFGPDLVGTAFEGLNASISMRMRMQPLSKALRRSVVGRMKPFGRINPRSTASAVGRCTFDVGHQPNQEALRVFDRRSDPYSKRERLVYFAGSFDVCCTGKFIRCRLAELVPQTDGDADVLLVPSRGARGSGRECTEKALGKVARKRGTTIDAVAAEYSRIAGGASGNRYNEMARYLGSSVFCLAPAGDICTSSRFYSAIAAGCIPVVLCDGLKASFYEFIDYTKFVFYYDTTLLMDNPMGLITALRAVSPAEVRRMQTALVAAREQILFQVGGGRRASLNLLGEVDICFNPAKFIPKDGLAKREEEQAAIAAGETSVGSESSARDISLLREAVNGLSRQNGELRDALGRLTARLQALEAQGAGGGGGRRRLSRKREGPHAVGTVRVQSVELHPLVHTQ